MKLAIVAFVYAVWLFAIEGVFYLNNGLGDNALQFAVMAGAVPGAVQLLLLGFDPRGLTSSVKLAMALLLVILLSYLGNTADWMPLVYFINTAFVFAVAVLVAGCPDRQLLRAIGGQFAVISGVFLVFVVMTGDYVWGRLQAHDIQPNFWGLMGLAVGTAGFAHRSRVVFLACVGVALLTILEASARGSLLALAMAGLVIAILYALQLRSERLAIGLGVVAAALGAALIFQPSIADTIGDTVGAIFKLDDPARGFGHGFTGRDSGWSQAFDLWLASPFFGVGFRQHEALLVDITSAHNAYLSMLADTGIFGLILYLVLLGRSLLAALTLIDRRSRSLCVAILVGYVFIGLFERRAINSGNPLGIFFLMTCFYALTLRDLQRAGSAQRRWWARAGAAAEPMAVAGPRP